MDSFLNYHNKDETVCLWHTDFRLIIMLISQISICLFVCLYPSIPAFQVVKNSPAHAGRHKRHWFDPWWGRSCGGGYSNPLQCSCLKNPMDREACWVIVYTVAQSQTQLKQLSTHPSIHLSTHYLFSKEIKPAQWDIWVFLIN